MMTHLRTGHTGRPAVCPVLATAFLAVLIFEIQPFGLDLPSVFVDASREEGRAAARDEAGAPDRRFIPGRFSYVIHYGNSGDEAIDLGATFLHANGVRQWSGFGGRAELDAKMAAFRQSVADWRAKGVETIAACGCATSIFGDPAKRTDLFAACDRHWEEVIGPAPESPLEEWVQRGADGGRLPSWYEGRNWPASVVNPHWRDFSAAFAIEHLKAGFDGMFYDNPFIHAGGDYSREGLEVFRRQLIDEGIPGPPEDDAALIALSSRHIDIWRRSRCRMMSEFFRAIRERMEAFRPGSLLFANCCLNNPGRLYTNPRVDGLFIWELAPYLDFILIEDSGLQACRNAKGQCVEYSHMYHIIHALSRGKPIAAITSQPGDWYNEPALTPLSIAEAVANDATAVIAGRELAGTDEATVKAPIRNYLRFFRACAGDLAAAAPAVDIALFYHRLGWLRKDRSPAPDVALALSARSLQYRVIAEDDLAAGRHFGAQAVLVADPSLLTDEERSRLTALSLPLIEAATPEQAAGDAARAVRAPAVEIAGSLLVRAFRRDSPQATYIHIINYDAALKGPRQAAYTPSGPLTVRVRVRPGAAVVRATVTSPDRPGEAGRPLEVKRAGPAIELRLASVRTHELVTLDVERQVH